jgi:phage shock protein C
METTVRRLTRSTRERIFAGVCGGAAAYLGIDPALARILFVAVTLITGVGPGILVYIAAWILVPEDDGSHHHVSSVTISKSRRIMALMLLAIGLLGLGIATLMNEDGNNNLAYIGPVLVIVLAIVLMARKSDAAVNSDTYVAQGESMSGPAIESRRLKRSSRDKKIGGVCGGFGEYFNVDPTLVRVLWILTCLLGGTGLLLYLILWIVIPLDADPDLASRRQT